MTIHYLPSNNWENNRSKNTKPIKPLHAIALVGTISVSAIWILSKCTPITNATKANTYEEKVRNIDGVTETYKKEWLFRRIVAEGKDLEMVHRVASNNFSKYISEDLHSLDSHYSINSDSFHSMISRKIDGGYELRYTIELVPKKFWEKYVNIIDMRGALIDGKNSEATVDEINAKRIPEWKAKMGKYAAEKWAKMQYLQTVDKRNGMTLKTTLGIGVTK